LAHRLAAPATLDTQPQPPAFPGSRLFQQARSFCGFVAVQPQVPLLERSPTPREIHRPENSSGKSKHRELVGPGIGVFGPATAGLGCSPLMERASFGRGTATRRPPVPTWWHGPDAGDSWRLAKGRGLRSPCFRCAGREVGFCSTRIAKPFGAPDTFCEGRHFVLAIDPTKCRHLAKKGRNTRATHP
jgi:hypothetical protein